MAGGRASRIAMPADSELAPGPHRNLLEAVHEVYRRAGCPSTRRISRDVTESDFSRDVISHQSVANILSGKAFPGWLRLEALLGALFSLAREEAVHPQLIRIRQLWVIEHYNRGGSSPAARSEAWTWSTSDADAPTAGPFTVLDVGGEAIQVTEDGVKTGPAPDVGSDIAPGAVLKGEEGSTRGVRVVAGRWSGPEMFAVEYLPGMLHMLINVDHPVGSRIAAALASSEDENAQLLSVLLASWAMMQDETPEKPRKKLMDIASDWGRYAQILVAPEGEPE